MADNTETESLQETPYFDRTSDDAVGTLDQDLLDRAPFAKNLAKMIARRKGKSSFVFSLQGPWGSGKSSIKNMALDAIRKMPEAERPIVIEFSPWQFRGSDALLSVFFAQIYEGLGVKRPEAANRMQNYAMKLGFITKFAKTVESPIQLFTGIPLNVVSSHLEAAHGMLDEAAKNLESSEENSNTLESLRAELTDELRKLTVPVLIVIDDIDRLFAEEIALIFQLVKANADFPNFVYLLLYDHDIARKNLDKVVAGGGENYLEKIVQHPVDVPMPDSTQIRNIWLDELKRLYRGLGLIAPDESQIWIDLEDFYQNGLSYYIRTLRDVWRVALLHE